MIMLRNKFLPRLSINIPGNLKKAFARNHELQTKLYERKVNPKAGPAKLNFINKLERKVFNQFSPSSF